MEIRTSEEAKQNVENFTKRFLELEQQKKELQEDVKALKEEFKEEGVPVQIVCKVINRLKALKKLTEAQKFEEDTIQEWLQKDAVIDNAIGSLISE